MAVAPGQQARTDLRRRPADTLSPRERQVAKLVGEGLSNRQIGEALVITEGTARVHVEHALGKLDLHSRAQLAVWAVQHSFGARDSA
jgi:DNA-binding NarL/FixJ family response regulator